MVNSHARRDSSKPNFKNLVATSDDFALRGLSVRSDRQCGKEVGLCRSRYDSPIAGTFWLASAGQLFRGRKRREQICPRLWFEQSLNTGGGNLKAHRWFGPLTRRRESAWTRILHLLCVINDREKSNRVTLPFQKNFHSALDDYNEAL
jgi:hypothetical protein